MAQIENTVNKKKIAKNIIALYCRQMVSIAISIYSVRVILKELGEIDYGIYNVVGGVVLLFSFISHSMASSTQRYLSMSIPCGLDKVRKTLSDSFLIYGAMIVFVTILSETVGVWLLNSFLQIPGNRLIAANCVLQCTIVSFLVTLYASPFFALVITYEKMEVFAIISIVESILKLIVAISFSAFGYDRLIIYAILILLVTILTQGYYILYCKRHYNNVLAKFCLKGLSINKNMKDMIVFAFWNLFRTLAIVVKGQGVNILLNIFFGPIINAARGIAYQIENALTNVVSSIYTASRPQIFQLYKRKQQREMFSLAYISSKISFFLLIIVFSILYHRTEFVIGKWLENAPESTAMFMKLTLINCTVDVFVPPIVNIIHANGDIRKIQLLTSIIAILNIPISYILLLNGSQPIIVYVVSIGASLMTLMAFILYAHKAIFLSIREYFKHVIIPTMFVAALSQIPLFYVNSYIVGQTWKGLIVFCVIVFIWVDIVIFCCGLSVDERKKVFSFIRNKKIYKV